MKLKFLGTADSAGIPVHNCNCIVCNDFRKESKINLSTSAYLEYENNIILLDAGIENISNLFDGKTIKAIVLTHFHADHCLGLLRLRHSQNSIECFHPEDKLGFSDLFKYKHSILYKQIEEFEEFVLDDIKFTALPLKHSKNTLGYLIEIKNTKIAYLTDCFDIDKRVKEFLKAKKCDYTFIDACYDERRKKGNHLNYLQASKILDEVETKNGFLMHISHTTKEYIKNNDIKLKYSYVDVNDSFTLS